jgi:hypothetical protein
MLAQPWLESRQDELLETLQLCSNMKEVSLLCDLLHRFTYLSGAGLGRAIQKLGEAIAKDWELCPQATKLVAINRSDFADSSPALLWQLKPVMAGLGDWNTTHFVIKMADAVARAADGDTIVLVDEFAGTGGTLANAIKWLQGKLSESGKAVKVAAGVLAAMEGSRLVVEATGAQFFSVYWLKRGISDHYTGQDLIEATLNMERLEALLEPEFRNQKLKKFNFGYKRSESIYYFENGNPPNNVFPIFWWPALLGKRQRRPLLRRV